MRLITLHGASFQQATRLYNCLKSRKIKEQMTSNYQVFLSTDKERECRVSIESSTTLQDAEELDFLGHIDNKRAFLSPIRRYGIWLVHIFFLMLSMTMLLRGETRQPTVLSYVRRFSAWSPADIAVEYENVRYNITTSRFVGARPEVDQAWREISYDAVGDQWIPKSSLRHLDMPASSLTVKHPETGEEGYRVGMEVFHHLHCLNLLRRVTYKEYYSSLGGEFSKGPEDLQQHTDHCIEMLRLNIQCTADIGIFTFYMVAGDPLPWPELNSKHVCRNFDAVRSWALENSVGNMEILAT